MTIIRSLGVSTLVGLMSAHRADVGRCKLEAASFQQASVDAIEAYLRGEMASDRPVREHIRRKTAACEKIN